MTGPQLDALPFVEQEITITPFRKKRFHNKCGGQFIATGQVFESDVAAWEHRCDKCQQIVWFDRMYPHLLYREM